MKLETTHTTQDEPKILVPQGSPLLSTHEEYGYFVSPKVFQNNFNFTKKAAAGAVLGEVKAMLNGLKCSFRANPADPLNSLLYQV